MAHRTGLGCALVASVRHPHQGFSLIELTPVVAVIAMPSQIDRIAKIQMLEGIKP